MSMKYTKKRGSIFTLHILDGVRLSGNGKKFTCPSRQRLLWKGNYKEPDEQERPEDTGSPKGCFRRRRKS